MLKKIAADDMERFITVILKDTIHTAHSFECYVTTAHVEIEFPKLTKEDFDTDFRNFLDNAATKLLESKYFSVAYIPNDYNGKETFNVLLVYSESVQVDI